jgi:hypothetical protein
LGTAPADTETRLETMASQPSRPLQIQNTGCPTHTATTDAAEYLPSLRTVGDRRSRSID